jgi:hypothetical protein
MPPYLVLLRTGFTLPLALPQARCALTAPFHPYPSRRGGRGGIFSVALAVGSRPPGVTWRPVLRSPDFPPSREIPEQRLPGQLRGRVYASRGRLATDLNFPVPGLGVAALGRRRLRRKAGFSRPEFIEGACLLWFNPRVFAGTHTPSLSARNAGLFVAEHPPPMSVDRLG